MLNRVLVILIVSLVSASSFAANVCETMAGCGALRAQHEAELAKIALRIQEIKAASLPQFGPIVKKADGSIHYMVQSSEYMKSIGKPLPAGELGALEYCASQGMHLPSVREFAQLSESLGAAGISETPKTDYYKISAINADGKADTFYFNYDGYKPPTGDLWDNWFWTSSVFSPLSGFAYVLYGGDGFVVNFSRDYYGPYAVRCVSGL